MAEVGAITHQVVHRWVVKSPARNQRTEANQAAPATSAAQLTDSCISQQEAIADAGKKIAIAPDPAATAPTAATGDQHAISSRLHRAWVAPPC